MDHTVVLTKAQAEALERAKEVSSHATIVKDHIMAKWSSDVLLPLNDLDNDTLIRALYCGYNVEKSLAERIREGIQKIYEQWTTIPSLGDDRADGADLADRITKFVTEELKL